MDSGWGFIRLGNLPPAVMQHGGLIEQLRIVTWQFRVLPWQFLRADRQLENHWYARTYHHNGVFIALCA